MTEKSSDIDKVFKDKLFDYKSDPKPDTWKRITMKLSEEENSYRSKRKKIYYSIAASTIFVIVFSYLAFYLMSKNDITTKTSSQFSNVIKKDSTNITKQTETSTVPSKKIKPAADVVTITPSLKEEKTIDEKKEIFLPDGSKVILNRNSKINYSTDFSKQRLVLLSGEAFFDIKPNSKVPFVIEGNLSKTSVIGTSFIIKSYENDNYDEINVITGKVSYGQKKKNDYEMLILAGNKGTLKGDKTEQSVINDVNYNSWLTEKIIFKNTKLKEVFSVLEKYFNVSVKAKNPKILNCEFTGEFEKSDINEILEVLSVSFSLSFNKESKNYLLSGKGCK